MLSELKSEILHEVILRRPDDSHKGNFGRVLLIGGNIQYGGAILMATQATVGSGAGLGTDEFATQLVRKVLASVNKDQILIADGSALTAMAENNLTFPRDTFTVATPHQMEWARLSGVQLNYQDNHQLNEVQRQILNLNVLVLKQHHTLIYTETEQKQLQIGGAYQATGGMGDVLAGIVAGFAGQFKANTTKAVEAAVYAHSAIAQEMAGHSYVVKPTFIADSLPNYMARIQSNL